MSNLNSNAVKKESPDELFSEAANDSRYDKKNLERVSKTTGAAVQTAGASIQATGAAVQITGKTAKIAGSATVKVGSALNSTKVGAVVGVPLTAIGGITRTTGSVLDTSGKNIQTAGKITRGVGEKISNISEDKEVQQRIRNVDRSDMSETGQQNNIRNIRTSNMPGTPRNQTNNTRETTDQTFNKSYTEAGIQPQSLTTDKKKNSYEPVTQIDRSARVQYSAQPTKAKELINNPLAKNALSNVNKLKEKAARAKASRLNMWIWSTGLASWAFFQLPFAFVSTIFFGLAIGLSGAIETLTTVKADDGWLASSAKTVAGWAVDLLSTAASLVKSVTGFDFNTVNPINFAVAINGLIFFYGLFVLLVIYFVYKMSFMNPLFGRGAGLKSGFFIMALVGYFLPLLNLFPWFFPWTIAVWFKPK